MLSEFENEALVLKNRFLSSLAIAVIWLLGQLPIRVAQALGRLLGRLAYGLNTRMCKITRCNIELCFPALSQSEKERFCQQSLMETGALAVETCVIWTKDKPTCAYISKIRNEHLVLNALSNDKGLLVLAPHLGNWEIVGHYLGKLGQTTNMYRPPKLNGLDKLIRGSRAKTGCKLVPTSARGVAAMVKTLKNGNIAGLLPDQQPKDSNSGVFADFYGRPSLTMTLAGRLIQRSNCTAILCFAKRVSGGFELIFEQPADDIYDADPKIAATAMNTAIEKLISHAPEQYQWDYKRFRATADGSTTPYYN